MPYMNGSPPIGFEKKDFAVLVAAALQGLDGAEALPELLGSDDGRGQAHETSANGRRPAA